MHKQVPENIQTQSASCAACHRIVSNRGYVFSQLMKLGPLESKALSSPTSALDSDKIAYSTKSVKGLNENVRKLLPTQASEFRELTHEISKYLFQGALDELKPALAKESIRSKLPAIVMSADQKTFAIAFIENPDLRCDVEGRRGYFMKSLSSSEAQKGELLENRFCAAE